MEGKIMNQNRRANVSRHVWIYFSKAKCLEIVNHKLAMKGNNCEYYWTFNGYNCKTIKKNVNYSYGNSWLLQLQLGLELSLVGEDVINGHKKQLVVLSAIFCFNDQNAVKLP